MYYNKQTDKLWTYDSMGMEGDYISRWGCVISCLANILQDVRGEEFTPQDLNNVLNHIGGYFSSTHPEKKGYESCIDWPVVKNHYHNTLDIQLRKSMVSFEKDKYYIARVIHPITKGGHYINYLCKMGSYYMCYDVEDGKIKKYLPDEIIYVHVVAKK